MVLNRYLHQHMIDDAFPAGRTLQKVVHLALERGPAGVPPLRLDVAARRLTPVLRTALHVQAAGHQRYGVQRPGRCEICAREQLHQPHGMAQPASETYRPT